MLGGCGFQTLARFAERAQRLVGSSSARWRRGRTAALAPDCCVRSVLAGLPTTCYLAANTMADTKGANISRMVLKQAGRAKEKVGH